MSIAYDGYQWQGPVCSELSFYKKHKNDPDYLGYPWAEYLDKKVDKSKYNFFKKNIPAGKTVTMCQHIRFRDMVGEFNMFGIKTLYTPHKIKGEDTINGISLKPVPIYAVNVEDSERNKCFRDKFGQSFPNFDDVMINKIVKMVRKYLYSFIGAYQEGYLTGIRTAIFENDKAMKIPNTFIKNIGDGHFNGLVYGKQTTKRNMDLERDEYNKVLADSHFSLCPSGMGPNSIRLWESLAVGSIPVILSDTLELPKHPVWNESVVFIKEKKVLDSPFYLFDKLKRYDSEQLEKMKRNCMSIYRDLKL